MKFLKVFISIVLIGIGLAVILSRAGKIVDHYYSKNVLDPLAYQIGIQLENKPMPMNETNLQAFATALLNSDYYRQGDIVSLSFSRSKDYRAVNVDIARDVSIFGSWGNYDNVILNKGKIDQEYEVSCYIDGSKEGAPISCRTKGTASETTEVWNDNGQNGDSNLNEVSSEAIENSNVQDSGDVVTDTEDSSMNEQEVEIGDFEYYSVAKENNKIAVFSDKSSLNDYIQDCPECTVKGYNQTDYTIEDWDEIVPEAPFILLVNGQSQGSFYALTRAIDYGENFDNAMLVNPSVIVWDNIPVKWYKDDIYQSKFDSITEGIAAVQENGENVSSKLIASSTGYVVWDNYPKECGACESPISDQYEENYD